MKIRQRKVILFSIIHFLVDFACIFILYRYLTEVPSILSIYVCYNFFAFALQMPIGLVADRCNRNVILASAGCIMIAVVCIIAGGMSAMSIDYGSILTAISVLLLGLGNCCFHVGAGLETLNLCKQQYRPLGIFIAPGALGIYLGAICNQKRSFILAILLFLLILFTLSMLFLESKERKAKRHVFTSENETLSFQYSDYSQRTVAFLCLFIVVCIRSCLGVILDFEWKDATWGAILAAAVVFGKIAGGFMADRCGVKGAALISLGASAVLFLLSNYSVAGVLAVFSFNMTMPVTLGEAAKQLPKSKGFAFGTLSFALFLGILPMHTDWIVPFKNPIGYAVLALVSLLFFLAGLHKECRG